MAEYLTTLQTLAIWHRIVSRSLSELPHDFTTRQLSLLLSVYLQPGPHTVRSLAQSLNISKAAVCRAIDTLSEAGLVKRKKDETDRRNVFIQRTIQGSVFLSDFADILMQELEPLKIKELVAA